MRTLLFVVLAGCASGPVYKLSISATTPIVAHPANCDFRVLALAPTGGDFEEIAILTETYQNANDPEVFKRLVHDDVCRVGGDVVVTEVNGGGGYVRGTILRARAASPATP